MGAGRVVIVEAMIKDKGGKILLLKRSSKNRYYVNKWQLPGGKVEFGEDLQKAIRREIKEETGRIAIKPKLERVFSVKEKHNIHTSEVTLLLYSAEIRGEIKLSKDHSEYRYIALKDIKQSALMKISKTSLFSKH